MQVAFHVYLFYDNLRTLVLKPARTFEREHETQFHRWTQIVLSLILWHATIHWSLIKRETKGLSYSAPKKVVSLNISVHKNKKKKTLTTNYFFFSLNPISRLATASQTDPEEWFINETKTQAKPLEYAHGVVSYRIALYFRNKTTMSY